MSSVMRITPVMDTFQNHIPEKQNGVDDIISNQKTGLKNQVESFCEETTAHGLGHAVREVSWVRKFWLFIFLAALVGNCYHCSSVVRTYLDYPSEEKTTLAEGMLTFPYVTVCNMQAYSIKNKHRMQRDKNSTFMKYKETLESYLNSSDKDKGVVASLGSASAHFQNLGDDDARIIGHQLDDFLISCKLGQKDCFQHDFELHQSSDYFNCYTFHGNQISMSKKVSAGPQEGLSLILYLENIEYKIDVNEHYDPYSTLEAAGGVRVVVHEQHTLPNPLKYGIDAAPGYSTSIALHVIKRTRLNEPYGHCSENEWLPNTTNKYTGSSCSDLCQQSLLVQMCGCHLPDLPINITLEKQSKGYCYKFRGSVQDWEESITCAKEMMRNFTTDHNMRENCNCYPECESLIYDPVISQSVWPLKQYQQDFYKTFILEKEDKKQTRAYTLFERLEKYGETSRRAELVRKNFVRINVYFRDLLIQTIQQQASYELANLWSDLGGTIGLWAGLSIITVVEVIVLSARLVAAAVQRKKSRK